MRCEEDHTTWIGQYYDPCMDWIDIDDKHWRLKRSMKMADSSMAHRLSELIAHALIGHTIAEI